MLSDDSEIMYISMLRVAVKSQDWDMFKYGLLKTNTLLNKGVRVSELKEWHDLLYLARSENTPAELLNDLSALISLILDRKPNK
jgi:hypothetical protein